MAPRSFRRCSPSRLGGPDVGQLTMTYQRLERRYATDGESAMETTTP